MSSICLRAVFAALPLALSMASHASELTAEKDWRDCVMAKAAQFAKGRDTANVIVSGALDACFSFQKAYLASLPRG